MAVASLKVCWSKLSAKFSRIRDYIDVVDSYYRPSAGDERDRNNESNYVSPVRIGNIIGGDIRKTRSHESQKSHHKRTGTKHERQHRAINSNLVEDSHNKPSSTSRPSDYHGHHQRYNNRHQHQDTNNVLNSYPSQEQRPNRLSNITNQNSSHHRHHNNHHQGQYRQHNHHITSTGSRLSHLGYTKRKTSFGQIYFVNSQGKKEWHDPSVPKELLNARLDLDRLIGPLASNWEVAFTSSGKAYFTNHSKQTTQLTDPRLVAYKEQLMNFLRHNRNAHAYVTVNNNYSYSTSSLAPPPPLPPPAPLPSPQSQFEYEIDSQSMTNTLTRSSRQRRSGNGRDSQSQHRDRTYGSSICLTSSLTPTSPFDADINRSRGHVICENGPEEASEDSSDIKNKNNDHKELYDKISILRQELLKQQDLAHPCKIAIHRKKIFEESFRTIAQMSPKELKKRLIIRFRGEEGLDYGGVAREWFYLLSKEILNPAHGLFQYTSDDIYYLQINPDSGIVYREHLAYLNFCGRIMGMAVFHGHFIEGRFTLPFYKMLLNKPINLDDIEFVDPDLHRSLRWILENDITDVVDTTFLVQHNAFGQLQEHELKEDGRNISVNEENKCEYVSLYVNYRCRRGIEYQFEALQRGFYEIVSPALVENFSEHELELLIGGLSKIDVKDWRLHTKLKNCTVETPLIIWFWDIVESYEEDRRARLLQFVTGSPRVPIQGFKALQGVNSEPRLFTIHMIRNGNTDNLPKSHTCFNRIDLPHYETYDKLRDKLTQAIEETVGFAIQ